MVDLIWCVNDARHHFVRWVLAHHVVEVHLLLTQCVQEMHLFDQAEVLVRLFSLVARELVSVLVVTGALLHL